MAHRRAAAAAAYKSGGAAAASQSAAASNAAMMTSLDDKALADLRAKRRSLTEEIAGHLFFDVNAAKLALRVQVLVYSVLGASNVYSFSTVF